MPKSEITERAIHLLREIGHGRDRVFAFDGRPPGAQALMDAGYAVRRGSERMELTPTGCAFLAGLAHGEAGAVRVSDAEAGEIHDALGMMVDFQKEGAIEIGELDLGALQARFRRSA